MCDGVECNCLALALPHACCAWLAGSYQRVAGNRLVPCYKCLEHNPEPLLIACALVCPFLARIAAVAMEFQAACAACGCTAACLVLYVVVVSILFSLSLLCSAHLRDGLLGAAGF